MAEQSDYERLRRNFEDKVSELKRQIQDGLVRENNYKERAGTAAFLIMPTLDKMMVDYIQMCNMAEELDYDFERYIKDVEEE